MSVSFAVSKPEKLGYSTIPYSNRACFVEINNSKFPKDTVINYFVNKGHNPEEEVYWYHMKLNRLGIFSELYDDGGRYIFQIQARGPYIRTFAKLTALRYLDETPFPKMVSAMYKWSKEYPDIPFFVLFQMSHYVCDNINLGHAFMASVSPYNKQPRSLVSLATFQNNFRKAKEEIKEPTSPLVFYTPIGLNNLILNKKEPIVTVGPSFLKELRNGDLRKAIAMVTVAESGIKNSDIKLDDGVIEVDDET